MPKAKVSFDRKEQMERLRKMMQPLEGLPEFVEFMKEIHAEREAVIADLTRDAVVSSERLTLAAIGELRTYTALLSLYQARTETTQPPEQGAHD